MSRLLVLAMLCFWAGSTLLLAELRWFSQPALVDRLRPYVAGGARRGGRSVISVDSFRDVIGPLAAALGDQVAAAFGATEKMSRRLERIHSPLDVTAFRTRQMGWSIGAFSVGAAFVAAVRPMAALSVLLLLGVPFLAFLVVEQQAIAASEKWQRRIFLELPVVSEQLGMLLAAGYSLGAALARVSDRGSGACAADLKRVRSRIRHGLTEAEALKEWADLAQVDALDRLVAVLSLNREAADLGNLIAEEARSTRRDVQRELIETIERRTQMVWVPVTVAALLPGVIFIAIPFVEAMRLFSAS